MSEKEARNSDQSNRTDIRCREFRDGVIIIIGLRSYYLTWEETDALIDDLTARRAAR